MASIPAASRESFACETALGTQRGSAEGKIMNIRATTVNDAPQVLALYKRVAASPGGIARLADEVNDTYIRYFLSNAVTNGVALIATDVSSRSVAEIHAYRPGPYCFSHVLSELTVVVDPSMQGNGVGRAIFEAFLQTVTQDHPEILRVELIARQSNQKALIFYESLGFEQEGELASRIKNVDGSFESDIPMAWTRSGTSGL